MSHTSSFNITNADCYFKEMVLPQYDEFLKNNSSSRHALLTTILICHMYEWVNKRKFTINDFNTTYPNNVDLADKLDIARKITNGTKHFENRAKTRVQPGFGSGFDDGYAKPLNIELSGSSEISVDIFLRELITFWKDQKDNGKF